METIAELLLQGPFPELKTLTKKDLLTECDMWRKVWQWVPSEVKYYVARTGSLLGITARNYRRTLGILLDTHWELTEIELGVTDVVYDTISGKRFKEAKRIRTKLGGIIDFQFIDERLDLDPEEPEPTEPEEPT